MVDYNLWMQLKLLHIIEYFNSYEIYCKKKKNYVRNHDWCLIELGRLFYSYLFIFVKREARDVEGKKKSSAKSSVSTKRSRAAAIHNQSERVCALSFDVG